MKCIKTMLAFALILCMGITMLPMQIQAQNAEIDAENDVDPMEGRLSGQYIPDEFYGDGYQKSRSANGSTHDSRFEQGYVIRKGIDVSVHQGTIDWEKVKAAGIEFAFVRVGARGYGEKGAFSTSETKYKENIEGALAAGIKVGVYIFSQALNEEEAIEEAQYAIDRIKGYEVTLPVVMDYEYASGSDGEVGRLYNAKLSKEQATQNCLAFCKYVENAGYKAMVYANQSFLKNQLNADEISENYKIWLAHYTSKTEYTGTYNFWQYTDKGRVEGIAGNVDMDYWYQPVTEQETTTVVGKTSLSKSDAAFDALKLSWKKVTGAAGYQLQRYDSSKGKYVTIKTVTSGSTTSYIDKELNANTTYKYRIRAQRDGVYGSYSDVLSIKTNKTVKGKVTGSGVNIRSGAGTSYTKLATAKKNSTYTVTGSKGKWYRISLTISGKKKTGYISKDYVSLTTSTTAKPGKATLTVKASSTSKIKLTWKKVTGASGYEIQRYNSTKKKYVTVKKITSSSTVTYTNGSLKKNTTYKYRIRAYKTLGSEKVYGSYSSVKSTKTKK